MLGPLLVWSGVFVRLTCVFQGPSGHASARGHRARAEEELTQSPKREIASGTSCGETDLGAVFCLLCFLIHS